MYASGAATFSVCDIVNVTKVILNFMGLLVTGFQTVRSGLRISIIPQTLLILFTALWVIFPVYVAIGFGGGGAGGGSNR